MGILDALFNPSKNTNKGFGQAISNLEQTREITSPFYTQSLGTAGQANSALADFTGLNGTQGQQRSLDALRNTPGYQFALENAQRQIDQSGIARGNLNSGSTLRDLQANAIGLSDQYSQNYYNNLSGLNNGGYAAGSALTGQSNQFGNLAIGQGQARDAGNTAGLSNLLGIAGTVAGFGSGGGFGNIFGQKPTKPYFGFH